MVDTVSSSGIWRATCFCISAKPYHLRTNGLRHHFAAATSSTRSRVIGWCTVATTGSPSAAIVQQAGAEALVVVDDVELVAAVGQEPGDPHAEGLRLGEARRPGRQQLVQVDAVADLAGPRDPERVGLAVEVEAGHLGQPHPRVEAFGVGLTGEDLDVVTEIDQAAAEMADIHALPTAMRLASVGQQGDPHGQLTGTARGR